MNWSQVLFLFFANMGVSVPLLIWFRAESRADWRHMDANLNAIREDIKDFHGRLIKIEEARK